MKITMTQDNYLDKCAECIKLKDLKLNEYNSLNQIDMLSSAGNNLLKEIYILEGEIKALKWVIGLTSII